ncbi:MAG: hypothetical protein ABR920_05085 [Terriglobales bacterium]
MLNALHGAATKLRGQLGESLSMVQKYDMSLSQTTTSSLDALQALSLGDAKHNTGDELGAVPKAVCVARSNGMAEAMPPSKPNPRLLRSGIRAAPSARAASHSASR